MAISRRERSAHHQLEQARRDLNHAAVADLVDDQEARVEHLLRVTTHSLSAAWAALAEVMRERNRLFQGEGSQHFRTKDMITHCHSESGGSRSC